MGVAALTGSRPPRGRQPAILGRLRRALRGITPERLFAVTHRLNFNCHVDLVGYDARAERDQLSIKTGRR
jgi:hypothetical protein